MNKVDVKAVTIRKQYLKQSFRPTFKWEKQFSKKAIEIEKEKFKINLNKPTYIGTNIMNMVIKLKCC